MTLVSILLPAFHDRQWIADTIGSALAKHWPRKEIIVVDVSRKDALIRRRFGCDRVLARLEAPVA